MHLSNSISGHLTRSALSAHWCKVKGTSVRIRSVRRQAIDRSSGFSLEFKVWTKRMSHGDECRGMLKCRRMHEVGGECLSLKENTWRTANVGKWRSTEECRRTEECTYKVSGYGNRNAYKWRETENFPMESFHCDLWSLNFELWFGSWIGCLNLGLGIRISKWIWIVNTPDGPLKFRVWSSDGLLNSWPKARIVCNGIRCNWSCKFNHFWTCATELAKRSPTRRTPKRYETGLWAQYSWLSRHTEHIEYTDTWGILNDTQWYST